MSTRPIPGHGGDAPDWSSGWEDARREQMRRFRDLPLAEKVRAVEELERLARVLQEAVKKNS